MELAIAGKKVLTLPLCYAAPLLDVFIQDGPQMLVLMSKMFSSAEAEADVPEASKFGSGNNFLISILSNGKIKENSDECGF